MRKATLAKPPLFALAERDGPRVTLRADTGAVAHVFVLEEDVIRVLLLAQGAVTSPPSWAVAPGQTDIAEPGRDRLDVSGFAAPAFTLEEGGDVLTLSTARLRLEITLAGFFCRWSQATPEGWRVIAEDRPTQAYNFGWWDEGVYHYVKRTPGERYYGLGERAGVMDRAGRRFRLTNLDPMGYDASADDPLYKSIPYVLVVDGEGTAHGVFYDTTADPVFDFGHEHDNYHPHYRYMRAASGDLDYYMIAGPDAREVTRRYTWLTGRPALMPRWAVGYSGSTMTYTDAPNAQARMGEFIAGVSRHDIPCESFHLSSGYTSIGDRRYVFHWNRDKFPDVEGFVRGYAQAGVELVPNIKPALLVTHPRYDELAAEGWFVSDADGDPIVCQFWDEVGGYVDFTNPDAAAWWRGQVTEQLLAHGIRSTWNDNNEYEIWDSRARIDGFGSPRPAAAERPVQTLLMMRASRAAQIAYRPDERPYVVTRSGMAGMQRYAQTWSGDNYTAWKTLRFNQKMGLGLALSGEVTGLVTAPIAKAPLYDAGFKFPGHTEFLAELTAAERFEGPRGPVMMLAAGDLRTTLATIHTPIAKVPSALTIEGIVNNGLVTADALRRDFGVAAPRLAVAGLNPHAGEGGAIGREEIETIGPAVEALRAQGVDAHGPSPADTLFHAEARARYDAVLCMYHDQALIPVKMLDFWGGVNVTLGLPIVRTSPDHGTGFDIAGRGIARPDSLIAAIKLAAEIAARRGARA